jgi:LytR cell envelope-related transcriptional attenuator
MAPRHGDPWYRRLLANPLYVVLVVAGVLIVGGAAAFGVTQLVGEDDGGGTAQSGGQVAEEPEGGGGGDEGPAREPRGGGGANPANITVAVLNGTTVPGLAATIMDQTEEAGFRAGTVANFLPNQQLAESVVQYTPGHERDAAVVSRRLQIPQREAVNPSSQELAGDATVVVLVGADKAP